MSTSLPSLFSIAVALASCASASSGASCPRSNAPTYASFGAHFFASYCTGCHSRDVRDRHGAPSDQNFDSEAEIRQHAAEIDAEAAAGPDARNTDMPDMSGPVRTQPTLAEREQLGEFLACEQASR